jgi:LPS export ABC transporter protein LptC
MTFSGRTWFEMSTSFLKATSYVIGLSLSVLTAACNTPATAPVGDDIPDLKAERVMYGMDTYSSSGQVRRARTHADTAYMFNRNDSSVVQLHGVMLETFDESGRRTARITARRGSLYPNTKLMVARGSVVLITSEGKRVMTEELHYEQSTHRVWSPSHTVVINADGTRQQMASFTTDDKFRSFSASGATGATGIRF